MKDTCDLVRSWLKECVSLHDQCSVVDLPCLPTRVLKLSGCHGSPSIKLLETNGKKERYCALSHCWSPVEKQPLRTMRANLQIHLAGIDFQQLPKTFKDAVTFARGIDIDYVWIDSLCIIQDHPQDWSSEAKKMGKIYRNAALVIFAAGANDSTEGLFLTERPPAVVNKVPYVSDGVVKGSINITLLPNGKLSPHEGPLHTRGWALQEWLLSQRRMFFMSGGVSWDCHTMFTTSERGSPEGLSIYELVSWYHLLSKYTERKLSHSSDRPYALQGIVAEMQQTRQDQFLYEYGVWESELHEHVLWRQTELDAPEDQSLDLPSWCWAATGGTKVWCALYHSMNFRYLPKAL